MVIHFHDPGQEDRQKFEVSLGCIVSTRLAKATWQDPVTEVGVECSHLSRPSLLNHNWLPISWVDGSKRHGNQNADITKEWESAGNRVDKTVRSGQRKIKISLWGPVKNQIPITGSQEELDGQTLET